MAVPKKRKKLEPGKVNSRTKPAETTKGLANEPKPEPASQSSQKIDQAFKIMDHIDRADVPTGSPGENRISSHSPDKRMNPVKSKRTGFRFHFALDAVLPVDATDGEASSTEGPTKSSLLDLGFTIPFFWKFPVIGGAAKKIIKHIKGIQRPNLF